MQLKITKRTDTDRSDSYQGPGGTSAAAQRQTRQVLTIRPREDVVEQTQRGAAQTQQTAAQTQQPRQTNAYADFLDRAAQNTLRSAAVTRPVSSRMETLTQRAQGAQHSAALDAVTRQARENLAAGIPAARVSLENTAARAAQRNRETLDDTIRANHAAARADDFPTLYRTDARIRALENNRDRLDALQSALPSISPTRAERQAQQTQAQQAQEQAARRRAYLRENPQDAALLRRDAQLRQNPGITARVADAALSGAAAGLAADAGLAANLISPGKAALRRAERGIADGTTPIQNPAYLARSPRADTVGEKMLDYAQRLQTHAAEQTARAKQGQGALGRLAVDAGVNAVQMAGDVAAAALSGGSAMAPMLARAFGNAALEARENGADESGQLLYGAASAATEWATEHLFGGNTLMRRYFGEGFADGLGDALVNRFASTALGRTALRTLVDMGEEGAEEVIADLVNPAIRALYDNGRALQDQYLTPSGRRQLMEDALYSGLVGSLMGLGGSALTLPQTYHGHALDLALERQSAQADARTAERARAHGLIDFQAAYQNPASVGVDPTGLSDRALRQAVRARLTERVLQTPAALSALEIETEGKSRTQLRQEIRAALRTQERLQQTRQTPAGQNAGQMGQNIGQPEPAAAQQSPESARESAARTEAQPESLAARQFQESAREAAARMEAQPEPLAAQQSPESARESAARMEAQPEPLAAQQSQETARGTAAPQSAEPAPQRSGGLIRDAGLRRAALPARTERTIDALGKLTGTQIRLTSDYLYGEDGRPVNARINQDTGEITVSIQSDDPALALTVHETVHRVRAVSPEAYDTLANFVKANMTLPDWTHQLALRSDPDLYNTTNLDTLAEETVADAFGWMLSDEALTRRFAGEHRNVFQRLWDALRDLAAAVRRRLTGMNKALDPVQYEAFEDLSRSLEEMLDTFARAVEQTGEASSAEGNPRNPGGGIRGEASKQQASRSSRDLLRQESLKEENRGQQKELTALRRENDRLRASVEHWKGQTRRTTTRTLREGDVRRAARALLESYGSHADLGEVTQAMQTLGESLLNGHDAQGHEMGYSDYKSAAQDIAREIVSQAEAIPEGDEVDLYNQIYEVIRRPMWISYEDAAEIGDYGYWRRHTPINIKRGKPGETIPAGRASVYEIYEELQYLSRSTFEEVNGDADRILRMEEVLESLKPIYENPYDPDFAEAVEWTANDILDVLMGEEVRQSPPTQADRQAARLEAEQAKTHRVKADAAEQKARHQQELKELKARHQQELKELKAQHKRDLDEATLAGQMAQGRKDAEKLRRQKERHAKALEQAKKALEREHTRRAEQVEKLRQHYKETRENAAARRADSQQRQRLLRIARRLQNRKLPQASRALLDQYIGELDTVAVGMTTKTLENLTELRQWYQDQTENNPYFLADPATEKKLERLEKKRIKDLSQEEVKALTEVLLNIENEINTHNHLINSQDRRDTYALGEEVITDLENTRRGPMGLELERLDEIFIQNTLSPLRMIRRMVGYRDSDPLYRGARALNEGQRDMLDYQRRAEHRFDRFTKDRDLMRRITGPDAELITIAGVGRRGPTQVTITPAMRMSLYLHSLNDDNLRHIRDGGVTVPDLERYQKGDIQGAYDHGTVIKLDPVTVRSIVAGMTPQERAFARAASRYFNEMSKDEINAVSVQLKGYDIAQEENYFPINTDSSFTRSEFETVKFDGTVEGLGFLKERNAAKNPILLRDMNAVLEQSIRMHSKYVGLAIPIRNMNKILGVSEKGYASSVQQVIKQQWGTGGHRYIEKLMGDLSTGAERDTMSGLYAAARSGYAGAVLTVNASVAMKQAASYPTAGAIIGLKPLARAMLDLGKVDLGLIERYTPLQWYRSKGFSTQEQGDLAGRGTPLPPALNWIQGIDLITTRKLWKAAGYYVQETQTNLERGSEAYYQAVGDVYNRIIEETQPNYTVMQRPQLLRNSDALSQALGLFKTQPFQNFNLLYDAAGNLLAKRSALAGATPEQASQAKQAYKDARQHFTQTAISQVLQLAVFAGMTMAWACFRGKSDDYEDEDGNITLPSGLTQVAKDMASGAASMVPGGSQLWSAVSSAVFDEPYQESGDVTLAAISDALEALVTADKTLRKVWTDAKDPAVSVDWTDARLKTDHVLDVLTKPFGIPYENVMNLLKAVYRIAARTIAGEYRGDYAYLRLTASPEAKAADYYDNLYAAFLNDPEAYEDIYNRMISSGFSATKIQQNMESRMKARGGYTSVKELDQRYLPPDVQQTYEEIESRMEQSEIWSHTTSEQRQAAGESLYSLLMRPDSTGKRAREIVEGGEDMGIDEAAYLLYRLALQQADAAGDHNGSYSKKEAETAAKAVPGLSKQARGYLWQSTNQSWAPPIF